MWQTSHWLGESLPVFINKVLLGYDGLKSFFLMMAGHTQPFLLAKSGHACSFLLAMAGHAHSFSLTTAVDALPREDLEVHYYLLLSGPLQKRAATFSGRPILARHLEP